MMVIEVSHDSSKSLLVLVSLREVFKSNILLTCLIDFMFSFSLTLTLYPVQSWFDDQINIWPASVANDGSFEPSYLRNFSKLGIGLTALLCRLHCCFIIIHKCSVQPKLIGLRNKHIWVTNLLLFSPDSRDLGLSFLLSIFFLVFPLLRNLFMTASTNRRSFYSRGCNTNQWFLPWDK